jgi:hypothetical protein
LLLAEKWQDMYNEYSVKLQMKGPTYACAMPFNMADLRSLMHGVYYDLEMGGGYGAA